MACTVTVSTQRMPYFILLHTVCSAIAMILSSVSPSVSHSGDVVSFKLVLVIVMI